MVGSHFARVDCPSGFVVVIALVYRHRRERALLFLFFFLVFALVLFFLSVYFLGVFVGCVQQGGAYWCVKMWKCYG